MKIKFCGAARQVTGSSHLITLDDGYKILLDCGLYQGSNQAMEDFNNSFYYDPKEIDLLLLSHAHIDHAGRLPKLTKDGYTGPIYCTHATRSLCAIMLLDSAKIQVRDAEYFNKKQLKKKKSKRKPLREALYKSEDAASCMEQFISCGYERWTKINDKVEVMFRDAGHILGSASVNIRIKEGGEIKRISFTGDVGRPGRPILRDPIPMPEADYVITESTYGNKLHSALPGEKDKFLEILKKTVLDKKGKLIIPAFSVGRTQEIIYLLDQMYNDGLLPKTPVYVDSPLAVNATQIFGTHPECYDNALNEYLLIDDDPFGFNSLTYIRDVALSKSLNNSNEPSIIISSSGMMNAGRVKHHLFNNIDHEKNTFLIVGYCAPDTPGGMLRNGIESIKLFGERKFVKAEVQIMDSFSGHADKNELIEFLGNQKGTVKQTFLVHGEIDRQEPFKHHMKEAGHEESIIIPDLGQSFDLI